VAKGKVRLRDLFKFLLSEIASVKTARNKWYYGWGIRYWHWPKPVWIYNVSGFDAVELALSNGQDYRIGTDEPQALEAALNGEIKIHVP